MAGMNIGLYQAAAGMNATSRWQEVVAENLSSSAIPGFKKQNLSFSAVQAGLMGLNSTEINGPNRHFALPNTTSGTDFQPGIFRPTGAPTDIALEGRGFFQVQLPNGTTAYTRDGEFHPNAQGVLVTKQGYPVEGSNGPIQLDPRSAMPITISPQGDVSQGDILRGTLKLTDFNDYGRLDNCGGGYFRANDPGLMASSPDKTSVLQGYLESANTTTVSEMAGLIASTRLFEANQKVAQAEDERMARLITDVGNPI